MRADAQRNYDRLLHEARQAFIVHGTEAPLEDIARHAGVGVGTLYRHFPDRYALMNAVFEMEVDALGAKARGLLDADDPGEALLAWLRAVAVHSTMYRGLSAAVMEASDNRMPSCKGRLYADGESLLRRAQEAGAIRADASIGDLLKLTSALVLCAEKAPDDRGLFDRLLALVTAGLWPQAGAVAEPEPGARARSAAGGA